MGSQTILTFLVANASGSKDHTEHSPALGWIMLLLYDGFDRVRGSEGDGGLPYPSAPLALFPSYWVTPPCPGLPCDRRTHSAQYLLVRRQLT